MYYCSDEGVSFAIQKGVQISRSIVRTYKHNDMEDLERVLKEINTEHQIVKYKINSCYMSLQENFFFHSTRND